MEKEEISIQNFNELEEPLQKWTGVKEYIPKDKINHPTVKLLYHIVKKLEINPKIIKISVIFLEH